MIKQSITRDSGVFTPDESDHLNVALTRMNEKISSVKAPVIKWRYDVDDIIVDNAIENSSIKIGRFYQLNFSFKGHAEVSNFTVPEGLVVEAVDDNGYIYKLPFNNNRITMYSTPGMARKLYVLSYFIY